MILILTLGVVTLGVLVWWLAIAPSPNGSREVAPLADRPGGSGSAEDYVGAAACAECHRAVVEQHAASGHARTLRAAAAHPVAAWIDGRSAEDPERPGSLWRYRLEGDRLLAEHEEAGRSEAHILQYALGSGAHAVTFLTVHDEETPPTGLEHRLTYFAHRDALGVTPGQDGASYSGKGRTPLGRELDANETWTCLNCHTTRTSAESLDRLDPRSMIADVSCERCHGPGRAHVEAASRGGRDLAMPFGQGRWTAHEQVRLCGQCHRLPSMAPASEIRPDNPLLARFQPIGLLQSSCYTRSEGRLSCTGCHDPHAKVLNDRPAYEAACLSCHKSPGSSGHATAEGCPVSPRSGCIECHMPRVNSGQGMRFTDHWIRVRDDAGSSADDAPAGRGRRLEGRPFPTPRE